MSLAALQSSSPCSLLCMLLSSSSGTTAPQGTATHSAGPEAQGQPLQVPLTPALGHSKVWDGGKLKTAQAGPDRRCERHTKGTVCTCRGDKGAAVTSQHTQQTVPLNSGDNVLGWCHRDVTAGATSLHSWAPALS